MNDEAPSKPKDQNVIKERVDALSNEKTDVLIYALRRRGYVVLAEDQYQRLLGVVEDAVSSGDGERFQEEEGV